ncbi:hypothetical protein DM860_005651 [Cuscuta australis]|uniref:Uncharacterized protein n=1 Tax=Cuscuta australis TaxID=267555 RepID=A0A328DRA3_9ASTE|nr:hypothetical protein DM860_005651 [Cuscuta australis]
MRKTESINEYHTELNDEGMDTAASALKRKYLRERGQSADRNSFTTGRIVSHAERQLPAVEGGSELNADWAVRMSDERVLIGELRPIRFRMTAGDYEIHNRNNTAMWVAKQVPTSIPHPPITSCNHIVKFLASTIPGSLLPLAETITTNSYHRQPPPPKMPPLPLTTSNINNQLLSSLIAIIAIKGNNHILPSSSSSSTYSHHRCK